MRPALALPLMLALAACAAAPPVPVDQLPGEFYSGRPGASLRLQLEDGGSFHLDGSGLLGRKIDGSWSVEGDRVLLHTDDETVERSDRVMALRVESLRLYLVDEELVASFDDGSIERDEDQLVFHRLLPETK